MNRSALIFTTILLFAANGYAQQEESRLPDAKPKARTVAELAEQTVVVFNENDRDSTALAALYAERRGIPPKHLIPLRSPQSEEITRGEFDGNVAEPLRQALIERGFWKLVKRADGPGPVQESKIRFAVLMRGIPLRVSAVGAYDGDKREGNPPEIFQRNECSVDSELSILGLATRQISGVIENPYFRADRTIDDANLGGLLLVCRLDAPTPAIVRQMIEDSLGAEAKGLRGFTYIDARGVTEGPMMLGDRWFHNAARDAREHGLPVILDNGPALFPPAYPMRNAAIYLGWYAEHVTGPFARESFRFTPGAVALHLHSFSAVTLRDKTQNWCAPLLAAGAAATLGNVYEPYLGLTPQPDIFAQRLREGFTFAEAGYMSQRALSWMTTFVGDPLYRPFANLVPDPKNPWDAYRAGVRTWLEKSRAAGETAMRDAAKRLKSGIVSECTGLLELSGNDQNAAIEAFRQARAAYDQADDRVRVAIHESGAIAAEKGTADAGRFLREQASTNGASDSAGLLTELASFYGKPPEPPKAKPTKTPVKKKP
jgi:uncharacterized protein (TIGR03790 family)